VNRFTLSPRAQHYWFNAILFVLIFNLFRLGLKSPISSRWLDFPVYWEAGEKALKNQTLYDIVGHFQYKYSPFIALGFGRIFGSFSFQLASWAFHSLAWGGWILWFYLHLRAFLQRSNFFAVIGNQVEKKPKITVGSSRYLGIAISFAATLLFYNALRLDLELGQMNVLCLLLLSAGFLGMKVYPSSIFRDLFIGLSFAIAVQIKLFCLIFCPFLFFRREWRILFSALIFFGMTTLGILAIQRGFEAAWLENEAWVRSLFSSTKDLIFDVSNVSLVGWSNRRGGDVLERILWIPACFAILLLSFLFRKKDPFQVSAILFLGVIFLTPLVWTYWVIFLAPLFILHFSFKWRNGFSFSREDALWFPVALIFQAQHSHLNMNYTLFPGLILFTFLTRKTIYEVFKSADCLDPSRSR
jgi:hypothetical protein